MFCDSSCVLVSYSGIWDERGVDCERDERDRSISE